MHLCCTLERYSIYLCMLVKRLVKQIRHHVPMTTITEPWKDPLGTNILIFSATTHSSYMHQIREHPLDQSVQRWGINSAQPERPCVYVVRPMAEGSAGDEHIYFNCNYIL
jgi:hypothetical protein